MSFENGIGIALSPITLYRDREEFLCLNWFTASSGCNSEAINGSQLVTRLITSMIKALHLE
jgi:hypothetical protein